LQVHFCRRELRAELARTFFERFGFFVGAVIQCEKYQPGADEKENQRDNNPRELFASNWVGQLIEVEPQIQTYFAVFLK
jgi:hypothetical protein